MVFCFFYTFFTESIRINPKTKKIATDKKPILCEYKKVIVPTVNGPAKAVILPEKLNNPKPFPKSDVLSNFVIMTLLALCMEPIKKDMNITL